MMGQIVMVDPSTLEPHPKREMYKTVPDPESGTYKRIRDSVKLRGIEQPLKVQSSTNVIIGGHTRWEIALELNLTEVPVLYVDADDDRAERLLAQDNFERALDEKDMVKFARVLKAHCDSFGFAHGGARVASGPEVRLKQMSEIAGMFDMTERHFRRYLKLLNLIPALQDVCSNGQMGVKGGSIIAGLDRERQVAFYESIKPNLKSTEFSVTEAMAANFRDACGVKEDVADESWVATFSDSGQSSVSEAAEVTSDVKPAVLHGVAPQALLENEAFGDEAASLYDEIDSQFEDRNGLPPSTSGGDRANLIRVAGAFESSEQKASYYKLTAKTRLDQFARSLSRGETVLASALNQDVARMWDGELQDKLSTAMLIMRRMEQKLVAFAQLADRSLAPKM